ncbi:MAG: ATP-binding protein, partial [Gammaproteobacteria bacterium]|nr:ATP-binding protein [Gammaproteobacteria bacterium]
MLPAQERCQGLLNLIEREQYFVIHAARQSGKTTLLLDLVQQLNESGDYYALYCSLESVYGIIEVEKGIPAIVRELAAEIEIHEALEGHPFAQNIHASDFNTMLRISLSRFCKLLDKPLVILFDEVDCLTDSTLISFLRQLRYGYVNRSRVPFVHSTALVGMRNIRDYKATVLDAQKTLGSASPFNISKVSKTLRNFNQEEVAELYAQHTGQTGQKFQPEAVETVCHYTQGQPWLVNAIADEAVEQILNQDFSRDISVACIEQAVEILIKRRDTHIDSLMERLKEKRVQRFVEPVITGDVSSYEILDDDYRYVLDLGLLREVEGCLLPANPIYGEVMIRILSYQAQITMEQRRYPPQAPFYLIDGKLDMKRLLGDFQQFWRENSEIWQERYQYKEAAPHLVLQAFLQR